LASNRLGELVLPEGWTKEYEWFEGNSQTLFQDADGTKQSAHPGKPEGIIALANAIPDMRALLVLNLADNILGGWTLPEGWHFGYHRDYSGDRFYKHTDGREIKKGVPGGSKQEGVIAIANAIPNMGALTSLNLSSNRLEDEGAKSIAEAIKVTNYRYIRLRSFWHQLRAHPATG
jgi:hypothetical protein